MEPNTDVDFYRTELRVLQSTKTGEEFLQVLAEKLSENYREIQQLKFQKGLLEHEIRQWENGERS